MTPQIEEDDGDDEEMGVAETYADYWPAKCKKLNTRQLVQLVSMFS